MLDGGQSFGSQTSVSQAIRSLLNDDASRRVALELRSQLAAIGVGSTDRIIIDGLPPGASLTAGQCKAGRSWTILPHEMDEVDFVAAQADGQTHTLDVYVLTPDPMDCDLAKTKGQIQISVTTPLAAQPEASSAQPSAANGDSSIELPDNVIRLPGEHPARAARAGVAAGDRGERRDTYRRRAVHRGRADRMAGRNHAAGIGGGSAHPHPASGPVGGDRKPAGDRRADADGGARGQVAGRDRAPGCGCRSPADQPAQGTNGIGRGALARQAGRPPRPRRNAVARHRCLARRRAPALARRAVRDPGRSPRRVGSGGRASPGRCPLRVADRRSPSRGRRARELAGRAGGLPQRRRGRMEGRTGAAGRRRRGPPQCPTRRGNARRRGALARRGRATAGGEQRCRHRRSHGGDRGPAAQRVFRAHGRGRSQALAGVSRAPGDPGSNLADQGRRTSRGGRRVAGQDR